MLRNDSTIAHNGRLYQILDNIRSQKVLVEEHVNGSVKMCCKDAVLKFKAISSRPKKEPVEKVSMFKMRRPRIQDYSHSWRIEGNAHYQQYLQKEKVAPKEKGLLLIRNKKPDISKCVETGHF